MPRSRSPSLSLIAAAAAVAANWTSSRHGHGHHTRIHPPAPPRSVRTLCSAASSSNAPRAGAAPSPPPPAAAGSPPASARLACHRHVHERPHCQFLPPFLHSIHDAHFLISIYHPAHRAFSSASSRRSSSSRCACSAFAASAARCPLTSPSTCARSRARIASRSALTSSSILLCVGD